MAFDQIATSVTIISTGLKGYQASSFTNFTTSAQSLIASGSAVEIANACFLADANVTPNASSWTAITTANTAYITLTPSGTAGSQILSARYTDTAPVWSTRKQGWYTSAASTIRHIGGVTKTSATQYNDAFILGDAQGLIIKQLRLGAWDMNANVYVDIPHGISDISTIRNVNVIMYTDDGSIFPIPGDSTGNYADMEMSSLWTIGATNVRVAIKTDGVFNTSATTTIDNR